MHYTIQAYLESDKKQYSNKYNIKKITNTKKISKKNNGKVSVQRNVYNLPAKFL